MFATPVLLIIFNRPELTALLLDRLKEVQPAYIYVAADGAREGNKMDEVRCRRTRELIDEKITWPCEIKKLYRDQNLGCGKAVSSAITWFFENVEQGIILEDDCFPNASFFLYCRELLDTYKERPEVMHIGGVNFQDGIRRGDGDYYFSAVSHVWGWASWRRAWKLYDFNMRDLDSFIRKKKIAAYFDTQQLQEYWTSIFKKMYDHEIDTWDHQWTYAVMNHGGKAIIPNANLVTNAGFGMNATHTEEPGRYAGNATQELSFPLKHPSSAAIDHKADRYFFYEVDKFSPTGTGTVTRVKKFILDRVELLLKKGYLERISTAGKKRVIMLKADVIGDYVIARNIMNYYVQHPKNKDTEFYLVANSKLRTLIDPLDKGIYKDVIYFDTAVAKKFKSLFRFYAQLKKLKSSTVLFPVYSPTHQMDELVMSTGAAEKIGMKGDTGNKPKGEKPKSEIRYTSLIDVEGPGLNHEFSKVKLFFEHRLGEPIPVRKPSLPRSPAGAAFRRILVCPGSAGAYKMWSLENYAALISRIAEAHPAYRIDVFCGPAEEALGEELQKLTSRFNDILNIQDISLLCTEIEKCSLLISNDSAPVHIAAALDVPSLCIFNGSRYGRFVPYPAEIAASSFSIVPPLIRDMLDSGKPEYRQYLYRNLTNEDINHIPVEEVYTLANSILSSLA